MSESADNPVCKPDVPEDLSLPALPDFPAPRVARPCSFNISPSLALDLNLRSVFNLIINTEFFYIDDVGDSYVDESGNFYLEN